MEKGKTRLEQSMNQLIRLKNYINEKDMKKQKTLKEHLIEFRDELVELQNKKHL